MEAKVVANVSRLLADSRTLKLVCMAQTCTHTPNSQYVGTCLRYLLEILHRTGRATSCSLIWKGGRHVGARYGVLQHLDGYRQNSSRCLHFANGLREHTTVDIIVSSGGPPGLRSTLYTKRSDFGSYLSQHILRLPDFLYFLGLKLSDDDLILSNSKHEL